MADEDVHSLIEFLSRYDVVAGCDRPGSGSIRAPRRGITGSVANSIDGLAQLTEVDALDPGHTGGERLVGEQRRCHCGVVEVAGCRRWIVGAGGRDAASHAGEIGLW